MQALQQQNVKARDDRAALRSAIETIQASLEQLDESFEVLGIPPGSSAADARSAYLKLARRYHPDKFRT